MRREMHQRQHHNDVFATAIASITYMTQAAENATLLTSQRQAQRTEPPPTLRTARACDPEKFCWIIVDWAVATLGAMWPMLQVKPEPEATGGESGRADDAPWPAWAWAADALESV